MWSPGRFGVVGFFLVSGFIVPRSLEQRGDVKAWWTSRIYRLFPPYWFSLLFIGLLAVAGLPGLTGVDTGSLKAWIANLTMLQGFAHIPDINPVAWTLGLEMVLYFAITVAFVKGFLRQTWLIASTLLFLIGASSILFPTILHIRFPAGGAAVFGSIVAGLALFRWFTGDLEKLETGLITGLCVAVTVASSIVNYSPTRLASDPLQPTQFCAIFSAVTGYAFFLGMLRLRKASFPAAILWLGKISYSLYLLHPIALALVPHGLNSLIAVPLEVGLSVAFAWFGYECIEVPSIEMARKRLSAKILRLTPNAEPVHEEAA